MFKLSFNVTFIVVVVCIGAVRSQDKPNIVMFLTDDQDLVLGGMNPMKNVQRFIANEGAVFVNSFVASPICCPSRASILSGMYPHNHGTRNNSMCGGCNGHNWKIIENKTFAPILMDNGYDTFYAGKYLNQYGAKASGGPTVVPPGWSEWHGLVGNSVYYNYTLSNNGVPEVFTDQYLTDVIRDLGLKYIESRQKEELSKPFLMVLAPPAPHQPFTPAPRHVGQYSNITAMKSPNFNIKVNNKHWLMRMPPSPLPPAMLPELDRVYRSRWEALLAVDEMVADIIHALDKIQALENTFVIYTSDNGYHIGQFSQVYDKRQPYETDIRVPLAIRGPGIVKKNLVYNPTINVDLAPTILSLAGVKVPDSMDGVPLNFTSNGAQTEFEERNMLIEYHGEGSKNTVEQSCPWKQDGNLSECWESYACKCQDARNNTYACVRHLHPTINYKYCLFNDTQKFEEMYDLDVDPYELQNTAHETFPAVRLWYQLLLSQLQRCVGAEQCNTPVHHNNVDIDYEFD